MTYLRQNRVGTISYGLSIRILPNRSVLAWILNRSSHCLAHIDSNAQPFTIEFGPDIDGSPLELKGFPFVGALQLELDRNNRSITVNLDLLFRLCDL
jgi:hypothetical protein